MDFTLRLDPSQRRRRTISEVLIVSDHARMSGSPPLADVNFEYAFSLKSATALNRYRDIFCGL
jgi:hypothetical protein